MNYTDHKLKTWDESLSNFTPEETRYLDKLLSEGEEQEVIEADLILEKMQQEEEEFPLKYQKPTFAFSLPWQSTASQIKKWEKQHKTTVKEVINVELTDNQAELARKIKDPVKQGEKIFKFKYDTYKTLTKEKDPLEDKYGYLTDSSAPSVRAIESEQLSIADMWKLQAANEKATAKKTTTKKAKRGKK